MAHKIDKSSHIGHILKQEREKKNLTLRQIFDRTHIPWSALIDIESGNGDLSGSDYYLSGYVQIYSRFLKVDLIVPTYDDKTKNIIGDHPPENKAQITSKNISKLCKQCFWLMIYTGILLITYLYTNNNLPIQMALPYHPNLNIQLEIYPHDKTWIVLYEMRENHQYKKLLYEGFISSYQKKYVFETNMEFHFLFFNLNSTEIYLNGKKIKQYLEGGEMNILNHQLLGQDTAYDKN